MKRTWIVVLVILILCSAGVWLIGSRVLERHGYEGTSGFLGQVFSNYPKSFDADPLELTINVDEGAFDRLRQVVDSARERGVIMPEGNQYVKAKLTTADGEHKAKIRIKGKLTDHVKDDKWSFRVLMRKGGGFLGMKRFSLQQPGTRNYLHEWLYHRIMDREGVIDLQYGFVNVTLNDERLGLYAYEEHFGQELLERNGRPPGPIFRFDPGLYWIRRLHEMDGLRFREAYADHHAAVIDSYDSGDIFKDEDRAEEFRQALIRMNALRSGAAAASDVLDIDKFALRHAVIDLIGGHHSMDWSDIKFYFDPISNVIEPLAYESFSVRPLKQLAGSFRYLGIPNSRKEIHDILFNDEELFRKYVQHLERVSSVSYLDSLFMEIGDQLDSISAIVYTEYPFKPLDKAQYYQNASVIRETLDFPKGMHTFVSRSDSGHLKFQFVPISDLPVEIHSIQLNGSDLKVSGFPILPARRQGHLGSGIDFRTQLNDSLWNDHRSLSVVWSVLGGSERKTSPVIPISYPTSTEMSAIGEVDRTKGLKEFLGKASIDGRDLFVDSHIQVENSVEFPDTLTSYLRSGAKMELMPGVQMTFDGEVDWKGTPLAPVEIVVHEGATVILRGRSEKNLEHVTFSKVGGGKKWMLQAYRAELRLSNVSISGNDSSRLLVCDASEMSCSNLSLSGGSDQLTSYFCKVELSSSKMMNAADDAILVHGGTLSMHGCEIRNIGDDALKVNAGAMVELNEVEIVNVNTGLDVKNGSSVEGRRVMMSDCAIGVRTDRADAAAGQSEVIIIEATFDRVQIEKEQGDGSVISLVDDEVGQ